MDKPARAAIVGAIVAALITLPGLGAGTLWDNSETAYGEVAREILLAHDWLVMHFNGLPYFVQPPLYFWVAAAFGSVFGTGTFALRLPSALATILMGAMTGYAVARQAGTRVGVYAAVILSSCLMQAVIGRLAIMDALLDLSVALTIFWWFRGLETGRDRYFVFGWIAAALGCLAKGPVAPVVSLLVIVPYYFWNNRAETTHPPSLRAWLIGLGAFLAIVLPWPLLISARYGFYPMLQLLGKYTFGRYTGVIENQSGPYWYYLPVMVLGFFPWIAFLPMAIVYGIRSLREGGPPEFPRLFRLAFVWSLVPLVFFSLARTKLPNYVALELPALALLTALYFEIVVRKGGARSAAFSAAIVPLTIGALGVAIWAFIHTNRLTAEASVGIPGLMGMGAAIFLGSLLTAILVARRTTVGAAPYALAAAAALGMDALAVFVLPHAEAYKPVPRLAAQIERMRRPGDVVAIQSVSGGNALLFYTEPRVYVLAPPGGGEGAANGLDPRGVICSSTRVWLVAPAIRPGFDPTYGRTRHLIATDAKASLFLYDGRGCSE